MNPTARRVWVLLFWIAAVFGIHTSPLARQAGFAGTAPVMNARPVSTASGEKVSLTARERQWLSLHDGTIRIGITVIPPQVLKGGAQYSGLSIDYIRLLERKLGCGFKLVPHPTWNDVIQAARVRSIDMIFAAQETPERRNYLLFTEPYLELPNMIVVRKDRKGGADLKEMSGWRVTTSEGSAVHEYLKREYPDLDLRPVPDELSGLMKVSMGEADAMVVEISRASYYIEKAGILNLQVSGDAGLLYRLRFAVRSDWPVLVGILDKGLAAVTDEEKRLIDRRWIVVGERRVFLGRAFWIAFAVGLAVIASAIAGVIVWNRMLSRLVRQRTSQLQQELAEREKSECALVRLNRQLRAISTCNMVLMHASDEQTLLNEVCRIVCEEAGYRMAWVGYPQKDDARTVRPAAWAGVEEGYLSEAGITWADTELGRGPTGRAIRAGVSACIQDFATDPDAAPWKESALQRGYRSSIALPLMDENGTAFGALCIYSAKPGTFTSEEMKLLDELAGNLAFGIATLRIRAEHKEAERQILAGEQLFRALVENSPDFIARYDREFRRIYVNPAIEKLFVGEQAENVIDRTPFDQSPLYAPQVYVDHLRQAIETAAEGTAEIPFRTAQGEMHWGHIRFVPEFGPDGRVVSVLAIGRDIHEIKENERRFRMLADNFPDFIARFDRDGRYTFANPAIEKAFGIPAEAIIGKSLRELPPGRKPEQNDELLVLIRRAFDEGVANESEVRWNTELGERVYEIRHAPEKDATGSVVSVLGIARDITERKQSEEVLRNTAQRLNEAQRLAHIGNWELDLTDNVLTWSDEIFRMFETDPENFGTSYEAFLDLVHPEDRDAVDFAYSHSLETRTPYSIDHRLVLPDGRVRCVHEQCETYYEGDKPIRSVGTVQDITERIRAEEKIKASEERLRLTLEATQIGLWDWDVVNNRYYASPIYYTRLGYEPVEGQADRSEWVQRLHPDDKNKVLEEVDNVLSRRSDAYSYEARLRHADGTYRWQWAFGCGTEYDQDGKVTRMLGLRIDIHERKQMEEELSIYRDQLEKLVRERTAELEAANKELEGFTYSVSHDLRAPLRHIDGFLELLQKNAGDALDGQARHCMDTISDAAGKMGRLVDDLLAFSRMGRHAISVRPVDMGTLVREVIAELEPEAVGRNVTWHIDDLPAVSGDEAMLRIVLTNLVSNALKFTRHRQESRIDIGSIAGMASETVLFVRDNGVGFDMAYADKLFGVFQRLHRVEEFEGTGIGLANVRRIIARHGGRTWAEGKPNQGAAFYFALPRSIQGA